MQYFSGFCLNNESSLFDEYLERTDFNIAGFSYGCIKACEMALDCNSRINKIQLISPAFFNDKSSDFKNMQLKMFDKDPVAYAKVFLSNAISDIKNKSKIREYLANGTRDQLEELLFFNWCEDKLSRLVKKGIQIECFIGGKDKIINPQKAKDFFASFGDVYFFKNKDHFLF